MKIFSLFLFYDDYKTIFTPTIQSDGSSNQILKIIQKNQIFRKFTLPSVTRVTRLLNNLIKKGILFSNLNGKSTFFTPNGIFLRKCDCVIEFIFIKVTLKCFDIYSAKFNATSGAPE